MTITVKDLGKSEKNLIFVAKYSPDARTRRCVRTLQRHGE